MGLQQDTNVLQNRKFRDEGRFYSGVRAPMLFAFSVLDVESSERGHLHHTAENELIRFTSSHFLRQLLRKILMVQVGAVLRTNVWGDFEIAFDHKNGHIVVEVVAAKVCSRVIDIVQELMGRE
jgi:hypothetical protein